MGLRLLILRVNTLKTVINPRCINTIINKRLNTSYITQFKLFSTNTENDYIVDFNEVRKLKDNKKAILIDVREPEELVKYGTIPGSINIPLGDVEKCLRNVSEEEFLKKYNITKPTKNTTVVFSCMKGNRSTKALSLALTLGFKNAKNYTGGWTDWAEKTTK